MPSLTRELGEGLLLHFLQDNFVVRLFLWIKKSVDYSLMIGFNLL